MKNSQLSDSQSPYQAPQGDTGQLKPNDAEYAEFKLFSIKGRAGRFRFLLYSQLLPIVVILMLIVFGAWLDTNNMARYSAIPDAPSAIQMVLVITVMPVLIMLVWSTAIQRLHDDNMSGWYILLMVVPPPVNILTVLWLLFASGTEGPNRYGPPSQPNKPIEIRIFWILLIVIVPVLVFLLPKVVH